MAENDSKIIEQLLIGGDEIDLVPRPTNEGELRAEADAAAEGTEQASELLRGIAMEFAAARDQPSSY